MIGIQESRDKLKSSSAELSDGYPGTVDHFRLRRHLRIGVEISSSLSTKLFLCCRKSNMLWSAPLVFFLLIIFFLLEFELMSYRQRTISISYQSNAFRKPTSPRRLDRTSDQTLIRIQSFWNVTIQEKSSLTSDPGRGKTALRLGAGSARFARLRSASSSQGSP